MNRIVKILMERDDLTHKEAVDMVEEAQDAVFNNPDEADDTLMDLLGLEPDYIYDLLEFSPYEEFMSGN